MYMTEEQKKKAIKNAIIAAILFIAAPFIMTLFFHLYIKQYTNYSKEMLLSSSITLGFLVALIFQLSCCLAGLLKGTLKVVLKRLKEFFENLSISFKYAIDAYWENLLEFGCSFWLFAGIILFTAGGLAYGIITFLNCYSG